MKSLHLTLAAAAGAALPLASGQDCACAPRSYDFALDFAGDCDAKVGLVPGAGVDSSFCLYTPQMGGVPADLEDGDVQFGSLVGGRRLGSPGAAAADGAPRRSRWERALSGLDLAAERSHAEARAARRRAQAPLRQGDEVPTAVTSVTFLEVDSTPSLNIINQDSTYFDGEYADGDVLAYESVSAGLDPAAPLSEQLDMFPGGVMLVLFAVTSAGDVAQQMVAWGYDLADCENEPLGVGDGLGWIRLDGYRPPAPEFCPAVTGAPTAGPTEAPTAMPVVAPATTTTAATEAPPPETAATTQAPEPDAGCDSKSAKAATMMFAKSAKAKSAKSAGGTEETVDAKAAKVYPEKEGKSCKSAKVYVEPLSKSSKVIVAKSAKVMSYDVMTKSAKALTKAAKVTATKSSKTFAGEMTVKAPTMAKSAKSEETMSVPTKSAKVAKVYKTESAKAAKVATGDYYYSDDSGSLSKSAKTHEAKSLKAESSEAGTMSLPKAKSEKTAKSHKMADAAVATHDAKASKASDDDAYAATAKSGKSGAVVDVTSKSAKAVPADGSKGAKAEPPTADAKATKMSDHSKSAKVADAINSSQGYMEIVEHPQ